MRNVYTELNSVSPVSALSLSPSGPTGRLSGSLLKLVLLASVVATFAQPQDPVNLRSTAQFAVLAGSLISNIPGSAITGDIGLSPAGGSMITGFGPNEVTGSIFTVDATGPAGSITAASELTTAQGDLTLAYNDAAGRTPIPSGPFLNPGSGNMGGMTLEAGLYKFTSDASIDGSDLTLTGTATDVWIFQIASELVVGNGIKIILAGGALPANIFWQVGTSATLGTTSVFKGTIMADQSISMNTGATLDGRALASIAAVTLASSTITRPGLTSTIVNQKRAATDFSFLVSQDNLNGAATLSFTAPHKGKAVLTLKNMRGQEIAKLFDGDIEAGKTTQVLFRTEGLSKGIHFSSLALNGIPHMTRKILIH